MVSSNGYSNSHLINANLISNEQHQVENFLVKKFGKSQTEEIIRERLSQENDSLKKELVKLRPLPA